MTSANPLITGLRGIKSTYRSLHHRNYRLFFGGQSISLIGTWMQQLAVSWLTYRLTHSSLLLGVVGFSSLIPTFLLAPFTGVFVDRWDRRNIMIVTQILAMLQALVLSVLVLTHVIAVWHIIALTLLLGFINSLDNPARQAIVIDLVENQGDLSNAIALNASMFNAARLIGPSIAGAFIALVGEGVCFLLNGLSFIAVIMCLLAMKIRPKQKERQSVPLWKDMKEGFAYAFGFLPIRAILIFVAWGNVMGISYSVLMPVIARDILHGDAHTFGFLMASSGCGALISSIYLASRKSVQGLERVLIITSLLFGTGLILFSISTILWLSMFFMLLIGFGMVSQFAVSNTVLQTIVEEDKRGRVMSFFIMASIGMIPFGSLLAGSIAHIIGAPRTIFMSGILCVLGGSMFAMKLPSINKMIRRIHIKKGMLLEEEKGI